MTQFQIESPAAPRARLSGLVVEELSGEVLVYDEAGHRAHCLSEAAGAVWRACNGERSVSELAAAAGVSLVQVEAALQQLAAAQLLEAAPVSVAQAAATYQSSSSMSRRAALRKAGVVAAGVAAGVAVTSIVAPTAHAATSLQPNGSSCTANSQCASGNCAGAPNGVCM